MLEAGKIYQTQSGLIILILGERKTIKETLFLTLTGSIFHFLKAGKVYGTPRIQDLKCKLLY